MSDQATQSGPLRIGNGPYRIAFLVNSFPATSETFILNQITALLQRGHSIQIFAQHRGANEAAHSEIQQFSLGERTTYMPPIPGNYWSRVLQAFALLAGQGTRSLRHIPYLLDFIHWKRRALSLKLLYSAVPFLDKGRFDIVHSHFGPNGLTAVALRNAGLIECPVVTSFHGYDATRIPIEQGPAFYGPLFSQGDTFTANSTFTLNKLIQLGCPPERVSVLPVAVDLDKFPYSDRSGRSKPSVSLLTVARLTEVKGLKHSIDAVAKLLKEGALIHYDIVGTGELESDLRSHVTDLGIETSVVFHGCKTQEQLRRFFENADLFVLPSVTTSTGENEGQGLVLQEAQATGLPVVASRTGGIPEGILEGKSGLLIPEADSSALAKQIMILARDPEMRVRMGRCGRSLVEEKFSLTKQTGRIEELYENSLDSWRLRQSR